MTIADLTKGDLMVEQIVAFSLLVTSLLGNILLVVRLKRKRHRSDSVELQEFLTDLRGGMGMLAVRRVDPESLIIRSPRDRR